MHPAYSVILFTAASGAGYGLLALLGLVGFNHGVASSPAFAIAAMVLALGMITVGLLSSTFHLGHPERAWRALSQWRSSWLSREGVAAVATYVPAVLFGLCWSGIINYPEAVGVLGFTTAVMAIVTVICTGKIYSTLATIRAWYQPLTVPVYVVFSLATGAAWLMAVATFFGRFQIFQLILAAVTLLLIAILKFLYWRAINHEPRSHTMQAATGLGPKVGQWEAPHTSENYVQKEMGFVVARRHAGKLRNLFYILLMLTGFIYLGCLASPWFSLLAVPTIMLAAWVERWLFFAQGEHVVTLYYGNQNA
jgi:sulfite dehydrogenase (quinone) subunit SoeC